MILHPFEMKKCSKCNLQKSVIEFGKCSKSNLGKKSACKLCLRIAGKKYASKRRAKMSDTERQQRATASKEWRQKALSKNPDFYKDEYYKNHKRILINASNYYYNNRARKIDDMRKWRQNNPAKMTEAINNWRINNPIKLRDSHKRWISKNLKHVCKYNRMRRAMKAQVTIQKFNQEQLHKRMSIFGHKCAYCSGPFEHIDHVKPLSKGGPHCLSNLRPSCASCNLSKHNKTLCEWLQIKVSK